MGLMDIFKSIAGGIGGLLSSGVSGLSSLFGKAKSAYQTVAPYVSAGRDIASGVGNVLSGFSRSGTQAPNTFSATPGGFSFGYQPPRGRAPTMGTVSNIEDVTNQPVIELQKPSTMPTEKIKYYQK